MPARPMGHGHVYKGAQASSRQVVVPLLLALSLLLVLMLTLAFRQSLQAGAGLEGLSGWLGSRQPDTSRNQMLETDDVAAGLDAEGAVSDIYTGRGIDDVASCPPPVLSQQDMMPGWTPTVPSVVLRRGVAYEGDMLRMDQFLHKVVVEREAVTVIALGSSCTSEFGGRKGPQLDLLNLDRFEIARVVNPDGWISSALDSLVHAYPPKQPMKFEGQEGAGESPYWLINLGIGGVGPAPWEQCLGNSYFPRLPPKVDLIFVEWSLAVNTPTFLEELDKVVQKLLTFWDPPPAIVFVNFFFWCRGNLWCRGYETDPSTGLERMREGDQSPLTWQNIGVFSFQSYDHRGTGDVSEDNITVLAQYYGVPSISMRDSFFHLAAQTRPGYLLEDQIGHHDMGLHPSLEIARGRYADVVVDFFRRAIAGLSERRELSERQNAKEIEKDLLKVPPPFFSRWFPDSYARQTQIKQCFTYETHIGVPLPIKSAKGFNFSKDADSKYPKPGLITWTEGSEVEFEIDTTTNSPSLTFASREEAQNSQVWVEIRYLVSYARMGGADLSCGGGCVCAPVHVEATINQQWSVPQALQFDVSQSATCVIRLVSTSSAKGAKFKVMSLTVMVKRKEEVVLTSDEIVV